jgi:uncharacterized membrane protein
MPTTSTAPHDENAIEASVTIKCSVEKVYAFHRDFTNLPRFLGDVMAVEQIDPATSRWTIQGPFGFKATRTTKVTEERPNATLRYETVTVPALRTSWEVHFSPGSRPGETEVREVMKLPLGRLGRMALAAIGKYPMEEVTSNLHRLKELLETGKVTNTSYAVPIKFA